MKRTATTASRPSGRSATQSNHPTTKELHRVRLVPELGQLARHRLAVHQARQQNSERGLRYPWRNAGNSPFSEQMYADGYKNITNIDFSEIVVEDMQLKYKDSGYDSTFRCTAISMQTFTPMPVASRQSSKTRPVTVSAIRACSIPFWYIM